MLRRRCVVAERGREIRQEPLLGFERFDPYRRSIVFAPFSGVATLILIGLVGKKNERKNAREISDVCK